MPEEIAIALEVNGERHRALIPASRSLLDVLREEWGLTGAKRACDQGLCGACTVMIDGQAGRACLTLAAACAGRVILTAEGLARDGLPSPVQQAFMDAGAVQCGFCMPGMVMAATALLRARPQPGIDEIREAISGNLCRCSGYVKVIDAIRLAADRLAASGAAA